MNLQRLTLSGLVFMGLAYLSPEVTSAQPSKQVATVGDVLDSGGRMLAAAELQKLVSGATMTGIQGGRFPDVTFKNAYSAAGTVSGDAWRNGVWFTKVTGTWTINDQSQLCPSLTNSQGRHIAAGCAYYFQLNGRYFESDAKERSSVVNERQFTR